MLRWQYGIAFRILFQCDFVLAGAPEGGKGEFQLERAVRCRMKTIGYVEMPVEMDVVPVITIACSCTTDVSMRSASASAGDDVNIATAANKTHIAHKQGPG